MLLVKGESSPQLSNTRRGRLMLLKSRKALIEEDYVVAAALAREVRLVESRLGKGNQSAYAGDILKHCQKALPGC